MICRICKRVKSRLRPVVCDCGRVPKVSHFQIFVDWHVECECGNICGDYDTYKEAVIAWNKLMVKP